MSLLCRGVSKPHIWRLSSRRPKIRASNWTPVSILIRGALPVFVGTLGVTEFFSSVKNDPEWEPTFEISKYLYIIITALVVWRWVGSRLKTSLGFKSLEITKKSIPDWFVPSHWQISVDRVHFSSVPVWINSTFSHKTVSSWVANISCLSILSYFLERKTLKTFDVPKTV